jgi:hypothetical protein
LRFGPDWLSNEGYGVLLRRAAGDAISLTGPACSSCGLAPRSILEAVPFPDEDKARGWDHVAWWWQAKVARAGYPHRVVASTCHYQRVTTDGRPPALLAVAPGSRIGPVTPAHRPDH